MSELREECYKCLNNQKCLGGAEYGSIYCMMNRKLKMQSEEDSAYAHKFAIMQKQIDEIDKRIKELEEDLYSANKIVEEYTDSIPVQKVKDKIDEINKKYEDSKDENGESPYYYPEYTIRVLKKLLEEA